ncbi:hypothetical protein ZIOFF_035164 [Zingiber officinale]|uniref:THH1/TOM1/TOM3 domain-containing protein n=1 Tax=Zingiber officinale TaxID=94328 RepID=A0A8J5G8F7_ZINOF|nr:hypothetical protein ZIOFF_035164 [Zingiber officinale]
MFLELQIQLIRIECRVSEFGWTTQKVFHLLNFLVNGVRSLVFVFRWDVDKIHPEVRLWSQIYYQARSVSTDGLRPAFYAINAVIYVIQISLWLVLWWKPVPAMVIVAKIFFAAVSLFAALAFLLYGGSEGGPFSPWCKSCISEVFHKGLNLVLEGSGRGRQCSHMRSSSVRMVGMIGHSLPIDWLSMKDLAFLPCVASLSTVITLEANSVRLILLSSFPGRCWNCYVERVSELDDSMGVVGPSITFCRLSSRQISANASHTLGSGLRLRICACKLSNVAFNPKRNLKGLFTYFVGHGVQQPGHSKAVVDLPILEIWIIDWRWLFLMLKRFPVESKGRRKKLEEVGYVTTICFICFLLRCIMMCINAFDKAADLDVLDHPILNFIYYMLVEILPSSFVLFILRKLPPKRGLTQYHPIH